MLLIITVIKPLKATVWEAIQTLQLFQCIIINQPFIVSKQITNTLHFSF